MKTIKLKIIVFLLLIFSCSIYAQYIGGDSDGSTSETVSTIICSTPPSFYPYFGGNSDAAAIETLENTTCSFPNHFYAYFGGLADAATVETLENSVCGFPPQFYTYFGGNNDGSVVDSTPSICAVNPPVANFTASATSICVGQSVTFTDTSSNQPFIWNWTFTGGSPSSSSVQNPVVTYNTAGTFEVKLVATNYNGSGTEIKTNYITVNSYPTINSTSPASRCGTGSVTLQATANAGTLNWYADASGGTSLATGNSFTTPNINASTIYYVEANNNGCLSGRTAITATVNNTGAPTGNANQTFCPGSSVGDIVTTGTNIVWYDASSGGNVLQNSALLADNTTYFASQTSNSCESAIRLAVTITIGSCLSTNEIAQNETSVYPNPVQSILYIKAPKNISRVEIYNLAGQIIFQTKFNSKEVQIDFSKYVQAAYLLKVYENGTSKTYKIIKK